MRTSYASLLFLPVLLASCVDSKWRKPECYPVVEGGSWASMQVGFRYVVVESSDATLVGQIFEDSLEGTTLSSERPWWFVAIRSSLRGYLSLQRSAIMQIQDKVCGEYFGDDSIPSDVELRELTCFDTQSGTEAELWLGVAELNEEGNPCRLFGHLRISGRGERHVFDLESRVIHGGDYGGCDRVNGTTTRQYYCPVSP